MKLRGENRVLFLVVLAQFACTSLWFAGNAVVADIIRRHGADERAAGHILSAVQFGFITGTLLFAILTITDRYPAPRLFFISAFAGAVFNLIMVWQDDLALIIASRFLTGFCLAGIYPVGVKLAADHFNKALGYLVGALVLGTALPHLARGLNATWPWQYVIIITSACSLAGGLLVLLFVPEGPYRSRAGKPDFSAFFRIFKNRNFRAASFGYFGHMWELYTFWAFVPFMLATYRNMHPGIACNIPLVSFCIIASGAIACAAGGHIAQRKGSAGTAFAALAVSGICCLLSPLFFYLPYYLFFPFLLVWGMAVVADSPQFSALVAAAVQQGAKGTALTIGYSIGFLLTIISIQCLNLLAPVIDNTYVYLLLAPGPLLGLLAMKRLVFNSTAATLAAPQPGKL